MSGTVIRPLDSTSDSRLVIEVTNDYYTQVTVADTDNGRAVAINVRLAELQHAVGEISYRDLVNLLDALLFSWEQQYSATNVIDKNGVSKPNPLAGNKSYHEGYTAAFAEIHATIRGMRTV